MKMKIIITLILTIYGQVSDAESALKFNWGKSKAIVTETIIKNNTSIKFQYQISVKKKGSGYILNQKKIKAISYNDQSVSNTPLIKTIESLAIMPKLKVDKKGELIDVIDKEKYFEKFINSLPDPKAKSFYKNPKMQDILIMKAYEKWCYWVCMWTDVGLTANNPVVTTDDVEFMGMNLPQKTVLTHHGYTSEKSKNVKLTLESVTGINNPTEFVDNISKELNFIEIIENDDEDIVDVSKTVRIEAIVEAKTLKPMRVRVLTKSEVKSAKNSQSKSEVYVYDFDWK